MTRIFLCIAIIFAAVSAQPRTARACIESGKTVYYVACPDGKCSEGFAVQGSTCSAPPLDIKPVSDETLTELTAFVNGDGATRPAKVHAVTRDTAFGPDGMEFRYAFHADHGKFQTLDAAREHAQGIALRRNMPLYIMMGITGVVAFCLLMFLLSTLRIFYRRCIRGNEDETRRPLRRQGILWAVCAAVYALVLAFDAARGFGPFLAFIPFVFLVPAVVAVEFGVLGARRLRLRLKRAD